MGKDLNFLLSDAINTLKYHKDNPVLKIYAEKIRTEYVSEILNNKIYDIKPEEEMSKVKENTIIKRDIEYGLMTEEWMNSPGLEELNSSICNCMKCPLGKTRTNFVFGTGNPRAKIAVVGEAPGAEEDIQGKPFVGRAGQLLTNILKSINFDREDVFICNILKCRPPGNRNPMPDEIAGCEPYLFKQLELIKPRFILAAGTFAAQTLLKTKEPLGKLRGKFYDLLVADATIKVLVTYHPAALLRNPNWKRPTWDDVKLLKKEYDKI